MSSTDELIKLIEGPSKDIYNIPNFTKDRRFAFWYVLSQLAAPGPHDDPGSLDISSARAAVTVAPDGGVDALHVDSENQLHLVQSKLHTTNLGSKEGPGEIEYLTRWSRLLCDPDSNFGDVRRGSRRLAGVTKDLLEGARTKVLTGEVSHLYMHFVSTRAMDIEESHWEEEVLGKHPLQVTYVPVGHDRVGYLFENFMAGVPPVGKLKWRVARSSQQAEDSGWDSPDGLRLTHLLIPGDEIRDAVAKYRWQLFASNVRLDLGGENPVNREVRASIRQEPGLFHLLNNGLTITCDESTVLARARVDVEMVNPQVVNGQQTSWALHDAGALAAGVLVPVKLITIDRTVHDDGQAHQLITRLARATNRQSGINESDLRTNDARQIEISHRLLAYDLHYARKRGQVKRAESGGRKVISMLAMADTVGNCLWESIAHRHTKELLFESKTEGAEDNYYETIFDSNQVPRNLVCFFLWAEVVARASREGGGVRANTPDERAKQVKRTREQAKWLALFYIYRELGDRLVAKADKFVQYGRTIRMERRPAIAEPLDGLIESVLRAIVKFYDSTNGKDTLPLDDVTRFFKTADLNNKFTPFFRAKCLAEKRRFDSHADRFMRAL